MSAAKPPDGGYGWVVVIAGFYLYLIYGANYVIFSVYAIEFVEYFDLSQADVGMIGSMDAGFMLAMCKSPPCLYYDICIMFQTR